MSKERSIRELCREGKVYVHCRDDGAAVSFLRQAEAEGFVFGDGGKPTERHIADLMAVSPDGTVAYATAAGHIAVGSGIVQAVEWKAM